MNIRKAKLDDAKAIARIKVDSWRFAYKNILSEDTLLNKINYEKQEAKFERNLKNKLDSNSYMFVCEDDNKNILGFTLFLIKENNLMDNEDSFVGSTLREMKIGEGLASAIYVDPNTMQKGAGQKMFDYTVDFCRQRGIKKLTGYCFVDNKLGMNFHLKNGAKIIGEEVLDTFGELKKEYKLEWIL